MGKTKELLKKTPIRELWWKLWRLPFMKGLKRFIGETRKDYLLFRTLPKVYDTHKKKPIDENKVVFIELRLPEISNSFRVLYHELEQNYHYDLHVHLLRNTFVPRKEYVKNCKKMLEDVATAKYVFVNEASDVLSCVDMRPETVVTQLWHACGAFKKFGKSTADLIFGPNAKQLKRHPNNKNYTYVTVSSPEIVWAYAEAMDLTGHEDIIKPVGTSRTDIFFRQDTVDKAYEHLYELFPAAKGKKVILYAPTFRGRVAKAKTPDCFHLEEFYNAFQEEYVVVTKHHPLVRELPVIPDRLKGTFAYDATKTMTIEDLLCVSDICISDYSSLIFEYSLFERPMLFFAYDLDDYYDWRGFYYPYEELTPGPVCKTNQEMIEYIQNLDERFDKQRVIDFKNKFMSACDGHATERIIHMVFGKS
ncbi:MAG: CDP-glycerol glycerophosphotransferase family protein [Eubacteriales bacterium]|nr:CDP-glycerol glycerophosphotransferase family protein [Eubacteriales bacterium]